MNLKLIIQLILIQLMLQRLTQTQNIATQIFNQISGLLDLLLLILVQTYTYLTVQILL